MSDPSDLAAHYSTRAFQTRISALAFVGAALGAEAAGRLPEDPASLGVALIVVVGSLAELNRRYTYSYLCAVKAAATGESERARWEYFEQINGGPWRERPRESRFFLTGARQRLRPIRERWLSRFLLSWGTYIPGVLAGLFLAFGAEDGSGDSRAWSGAAVVLSAMLAAVWILDAFWPLNPQAYAREGDKGP